MQIVRVMVADDFKPWCRLIGYMLETDSRLQVVGHALDGLEAVQKAEELQPNLILLDIGLPKLNGIEAAKRIRQVAPKAKILFVSSLNSSDVAKEALRVGGNGYVVKSEVSRELLPAIESVLGGEQFVSRALDGPMTK